MLSIFIDQYRVMNSKAKLLNTKNKNKPEMEVWALDNWKQEARRSEAGGLRNQDSWNSQIKISYEKRNQRSLRKSLGVGFQLALCFLHPNLHSAIVTTHWALTIRPASELASRKWGHIYVQPLESTQCFRIWLLNLTLTQLCAFTLVFLLLLFVFVSFNFSFYTGI